MAAIVRFRVGADDQIRWANASQCQNVMFAVACESGHAMRTTSISQDVEVQLYSVSIPRPKRLIALGKEQFSAQALGSGMGVTNSRRVYTEAETVALLAQVGGRCPLCDLSLYNKKKTRTFKAYELAHIYPLNPSADEVAELAQSQKLHMDVNDPDNIVPLCPTCHGNFDKPRTAEEYAQLFQIKMDALQADRLRALVAQYPLEQQIVAVVAQLHDAALQTVVGIELQLNAKTLDEKFDATMPAPTKRKVRNAVTDYFHHVRAAFHELERNDPGCTELIFQQVRAFYLKQKTLKLPQSMIFANIVQWIRDRAEAQTLESAEAVASFFIQNCEVFE